MRRVFDAIAHAMFPAVTVVDPDVRVGFPGGAMTFVHRAGKAYPLSLLGPEPPLSSAYPLSQQPAACHGL